MCVCVCDILFSSVSTSGWWWLVCSVCASFLRTLTMATQQTAVKIRWYIRESMKKWEIGYGRKLLGSEEVLGVKEIRLQVFLKSKLYEVLYNSNLEIKSPTTGQWNKDQNCRCGVEWTNPLNFGRKRILGGTLLEFDTYKVSRVASWTKNHFLINILNRR